MLDTRNSEMHSLDELRSQFGQFRESVLKELRPVSFPINPHASGLNASNLQEAPAALPQVILPLNLEADSAGVDNVPMAQNDTASSSCNSDEDVDGAHSSMASHASDTRAFTPLRRSPSSQAVVQTMSPAEADKQARIIERERDALLNSGLYHENGEKYVANEFPTCVTASHRSINYRA